MNDIPANMLGRPMAVFQYKNWRGEVETRRVVPDRVVWMDEPGYGYAPGWFLLAWDLQRKAMRQFNLDPSRMKPIDSDEHGRQALSGHGVNILMKVR